MSKIFLIGFMGVGKTTVGSELAKELKYKVVDTDHLIEGKIGKDIKSYFKKYGEEAFRKREAEILDELPSENVVVTTGGGIVTYDDSRKKIKRNGIVFFLQCDFEVMMNRLKDDSTRPLLINKSSQEIHNLYLSRLPIYRNTAHYVINTTHLSIDETVEEIVKSLKYDETDHNK
ncbi:shikimate kinase [Bacillus pakistanensis]|uniref:Shikimate kinase n=1 Tax=Rossellomorea pakistanensis TaxID=992288 RepID=A0ABS2N9S7_9BACI|nr:shikimate kinase [Bacillus pakistanensis]MBM7584603.1 shikimate kinase [Bacillus pakistanensis]